MERKNETQASTTDREVIMSRVFDAPRELVFDAWTMPGHADKWWGPRGFRTTTHEINVAPGGTWHYTMHGPDGTDYPNIVVFDEVLRPELLAYRHGSGAENDPHAFQVRVTFEDQGGRTLLTMSSVFPSSEALRFVVENYGAIEGGKQTLDRLGEFLDSLS